jgi:hypothetical protein
MLYCLNINTLQHLYIDILILLIKIKPSNLLGNLRKFWKKIHKLHNLKKKMIHKFNIKFCE